MLEMQRNGVFGEHAMPEGHELIRRAEEARTVALIRVFAGDVFDVGPFDLQIL